jgi:hypothetical protein
MRAALCMWARARRSLALVLPRRDLDLLALRTEPVLTALHTDSVAPRTGLSIAPVAPVSETQHVVPLAALPATTVRSRP